MIKEFLEIKNAITKVVTPRKAQKKQTSPWVIVLAVLGGIAILAALIFAIYWFFLPEDSEEFEDFDEDEDFSEFEEEEDEN